MLLELPIHHAPTLAVSKKALVPTLYALPGMQPIKVIDSSRQLSISEIIYYSPVPVEMLRQALTTPHERLPRFVRYWAREFDFLYVVGPRIANPMPDVLEPVAAGERFVMYRIRTSEVARSAE